MKITLISTLLQGCVFFEPTDSEITSAFKAYIIEKELHSNNIGSLEKVITDAMGINKLVFNSIEKVKCQETELKLAVCEIAYDYTVSSKNNNAFALIMGATGNKKGVEKFRFVKTSQGWIVANHQEDN